MANHISHEQYDSHSSIGMNNWMTNQFFTTLAFYSSALAHTPREERIALWISEHDQSVRGYGAVSFDLSGGAADITAMHHFPWTFSHFGTEKAYLLSVIDSALQDQKWRRADYAESDQITLDLLAQFRRMVERCREKHLDPETPYDILASDPALSAYPLERCPIHGIILRKACYPGDRRCVGCINSLFLPG